MKILLQVLAVASITGGVVFLTANRSERAGGGGDLPMGNNENCLASTAFDAATSPRQASVWSEPAQSDRDSVKPADAVEPMQTAPATPDPVLEEARISARAAWLRGRTTDLPRFLGAPDDMVPNLYRMLAAQYFEELAVVEAAPPGRDDARDVRVKDWESSLLVLRQKQRAEHVAMLGIDGAERLSDYFATTPIRKTLEQARVLLATSPNPLRESQYYELLAQFAKEERRLKAVVNTATPDMSMKSIARAQMSPEELQWHMGQQFDLQRESLERQREIVTRVLEPEQRAAVLDVLSLQSEEINAREALEEASAVGAIQSERPR